MESVIESVELEWQFFHFRTSKKFRNFEDQITGGVNSSFEFFHFETNKNTNEILFLNRSYIFNQIRINYILLIDGYLRTFYSNSQFHYTIKMKLTKETKREKKNRNLI